jgi:hypothetical protein
MDTLILTSLLVLEYLRSPAKNLSHFFQAIWLIGNVFRGDFHGLPEAITGLGKIDCVMAVYHCLHQSSLQR